MSVDGLIFHLSRNHTTNVMDAHPNGTVAMCGLNFNEWYHDITHRVVLSLQDIPTHAVCSTCALICFSNKEKL